MPKSFCKECFSEYYLLVSLTLYLGLVAPLPIFSRLQCDASCKLHKLYKGYLHDFVESVPQSLAGTAQFVHGCRDLLHTEVRFVLIE